MTATDTARDTDAGVFASYELFIDGAWTPPATGDHTERHSPADGRLVGRYARGDASDVDRAVAAARRAFDETTWPVLPARERSALLLRTAAVLRERASELGRRIALELGKPIRLATGEVLLTA